MRGGIRWSPHSSPDDGLGTMAATNHKPPHLSAGLPEQKKRQVKPQSSAPTGSEVASDQETQFNCFWMWWLTSGPQSPVSMTTELQSPVSVTTELQSPVSWQQNHYGLFLWLWWISDQTTTLKPQWSLPPTSELNLPEPDSRFIVS